MARRWPSPLRIVLVLFTFFELLAMGGAGAGKFNPGAIWQHMFRFWGYPAWFRYVVGLGEVAGAIGLLVPRLASWAALWCIVIMMGAVVTTATHHGYNFTPATPCVHIVVLGVIAALRWREKWMPGRTSVPG